MTNGLATSAAAGKRHRNVRFVHRVFLYALTLLLLFVFLTPFEWMASTAFKESDEIFVFPPNIIPESPTLENFERALFGDFPFFLYLRNTLIITVMASLGFTFSSALVAFSLSHLQWPDRRIVFGALLATMMIPGQILLIPHFLIYRSLGWIDTLLPLIVPAFLGSAFYIFLLRQFFMTIPTSLVESARIDGARSFRVFWQVVLPLSKPALITVFIFSVVAAWNDFMGPLIYLSSESTKTLAVGLADMRGQYRTDWGLLMAAAVLMSAPIMALFFVAQRAFIEGISLSGLKA
jgi:ABC-type glycerol-3-phosphate transport system permease component